MLAAPITDFLRQHHPFDLLTAAEQALLADSVIPVEFPAQASILIQNGQPADYLYVILQGSVRMSLRADNGDEILLDLRGAGGHYGLSSMLRGMTLLNVTAAEATQCALFPRAVVMPLLQQNPAFSEALVQASLQRYLEHSLRELRQSDGRAGSDHMLFTLPVRALITRPLVHRPPEITIQEAAQAMEAEGVSSLILLTANGEAAGIVTDHDLRAKVVATGRALDEPIRHIAAEPLVAVEADQPVMEALLLLLTHHIQHLPVRERGQLIGMLTSTDFILLQGASPVVFANEMTRQTSVAGLEAAMHRATQLLPMLFKQGAHPSHVARLFAEINDRVTLQLLKLAEDQLGPPPVPYGWAALGGEGRQEQTFFTDKFNLLVYANPLVGDTTAPAYFERLSDFMDRAFDQLGYPRYSPGERSSARSLNEWQAHLTQSLPPAGSTAEFHPAFFDLRPVGGQRALTLALRDHAYRQARSAGPLLYTHLARLSSNPVAAAEVLDVKAQGTRPIVDMVRVLALAAGVRETNTSERLRALMACGALPAAQADELQQVFEFFLLLRLRHQFEQTARQLRPDNLIRSGGLNPLEQATLKEAQLIVTRHQHRLAQLSFG